MKMPIITSLAATLLILLSPYSFAESESKLHREIFEAQKNPLPVEEGDTCIVCGDPLTENDIVLEVRGRRVPVARDALEDLLKNPNHYFVKLQPKAALFTESISTPSFSWGWLSFGALMLVLVISGAICSVMAMKRGLDSNRWFLIGFFGNFLAPFFLMQKKLLPDLPPGFNKLARTAPPSPCPSCSAQNHPSAKNCISCSSALDPSTTSDLEKLRSTNE